MATPYDAPIPGAAAGYNFTVRRTLIKTGLAAATALVAKYRSASTGQLHAANRVMRVTPIRVS